MYVAFTPVFSRYGKQELSELTCFRALKINGNGNSKVFDVTRRPWVDLSYAPANEIAEIIDKCPSGALKYELK